MAFSTRTLAILIVHGEGNREKVKETADAERRLKIHGITQTAGREIPEDLLKPVDPPPNVILVLRDMGSPDEPCVEYALRTWDEVEAFKTANGGEHWDGPRKQFIFSKFDPESGRNVPFGTVAVNFE
jgi:hypothetical protein